MRKSQIRPIRISPALRADADPARRELQGHGRLKGTSDVGDHINKKIIAPLANANKLSHFPEFNDATKLGTGKEMVDGSSTADQR